MAYTITDNADGTQTLKMNDIPVITNLDSSLDWFPLIIQNAINPAEHTKIRTAWSKQHKYEDALQQAYNESGSEDDFEVWKEGAFTEDAFVAFKIRELLASQTAKYIKAQAEQPVIVETKPIV